MAFSIPSEPAEFLTADNYIAGLQEVRSDEQQRNVQRYFKSGKGQYGEGDVFIGVPMGEVFKLSKRFMAMPLSELEQARRQLLAVGGPKGPAPADRVFGPLCRHHAPYHLALRPRALRRRGARSLHGPG